MLPKPSQTVQSLFKAIELRTLEDRLNAGLEVPAVHWLE